MGTVQWKWQRRAWFPKDFTSSKNNFQRNERYVEQYAKFHLILSVEQCMTVMKGTPLIPCGWCNEQIGTWILRTPFTPIRVKFDRSEGSLETQELKRNTLCFFIEVPWIYASCTVCGQAHDFSGQNLPGSVTTRIYRIELYLERHTYFHGMFWLGNCSWKSCKSIRTVWWTDRHMILLDCTFTIKQYYSKIMNVNLNGTHESTRNLCLELSLWSPKNLCIEQWKDGRMISQDLT